MKKILSLTLVALMLFTMIPTAFAAETYNCVNCGTTTTAIFDEYCYDCYIKINKTYSTTVVYTAANNTDYSITVPASLDPGKSGTVTLSGSWASNQTVKVTADSSVTLTNSINANDQKTLAVTFAGMEKAGDNSEAKTYTETVSVAAMPSDALFGTWDGKFNYYVELVEEAAQLISFTIDGTSYQAEEGMTWGEWVESDYNTIGAYAEYDGVWYVDSTGYGGRVVGAEHPDCTDERCNHAPVLTDVIDPDWDGYYILNSIVP